MRVFVTGATGTLGRPTVRKLVDRGHVVRALARSAANQPLLRQLGAEPVAGDLFDETGLRTAIGDCEAILHLATRIPEARRAGRRQAWAENDRIRTEGTRGLVNLALEARVGTLLYPSICLPYPDRGADWIATDVELDPAAMLLSTLTAETAVARARVGGTRGIVLRLGTFYGPTAPSTLEALSMARRGIAAVPGPSEAYLSHVWVDDAAAAVVAALEEAPAGVYNVVEDDPRPRGEVVDAMARAVGRQRLWTAPCWLVRLAAGAIAEPLMRSQRVSNRAFVEATGWTPEVPDARVGWARIAAEHR